MLGRKSRSSLQQRKPSSVNEDHINELVSRLAVPVSRTKVDRGVPPTDEVNLLKGVLRDPSPIQPTSKAVQDIVKKDVSRVPQDLAHKDSTVMSVR